MAAARGGEQHIPRPPHVVPGDPPPWAELENGRRAITVEQVRKAVAAAPPGRPLAPTVPGARAAAVLVPVFEEDGLARLVLTRRTTNLPSHQGQVAFPGGKVHDGESSEAGALREAYEEVGIRPADVDVVGPLEELGTVAGQFVLAPFVGLLAARPTLVPNPGEVARAFDVAVAELMEPDVYHAERWDLPGMGERPMHFFTVAGETVWGATARILHDLLALVTSSLR
ncbi:MAG TPA: CoA pyrophosphatase [Acidimicrobiales bacterium]|jgi:8-oxo-dGTP pyrophosphatase MutT (NUDIX family)|nr:CoA pyrophosphatase [Acidimicrobiales bacterium]